MTQREWAMLMGQANRITDSIRDNKRYKEQQILDAAMREREDKWRDEQLKLQKAMQARQLRKLDEEGERWRETFDFQKNQYYDNYAQKEIQNKIAEDRIKFASQGQAPTAPPPPSPPPPMFDVEGAFDPETGQPRYEKFKGKIDEAAFNSYLESMKAANAAPELQPNLQAKKKPGFFQRMKGVLPANGAGTQYLNALNQSVAAGEMTQEEAELAFAAKRAQAGIW